MLQIIDRNSKLYMKLNSFMSNHLELMDRYSKAVFILDINEETMFINERMGALFNHDKLNRQLTEFYEKIDLKKSDNDVEKIYFLSEKNLNIVYNLREIFEKGQIKYYICTVDRVFDQSASEKTALPSGYLKEIIGESSEIQQIKKMIQKISKSDSTILISGETGTGKEMFAHTIHKLSPRNSKPFVVINCGAIPDTLIESELFGYEKGSFTGANQKGKIGKFEQSNEGTLFLDEIENMSVFLQMKLLRVLEERAVVRLGGHELIKFDTRILAATNVDLKSMVEKGDFRRDLYYRLNIIQLKIPNLQHRNKDVILLSKHFISIFSIKMKKQVIDLSEEVKLLFIKHRWDGNVRELRNIIEYAMNFEESSFITIENLPEYFFEQTKSSTLVKPTFRSMEEIEREEIHKALDYFGWDDKGKQKAAKALNISRSSIYRKVLKKENNHETS